jgi:hypothetical protein
LKDGLLITKEVKEEILKSKVVPFRLFVETGEKMLVPLLKYAEEIKPDIIISDFVTFAGIDAAKKLGIPLLINAPSSL